MTTRRFYLALLCAGGLSFAQEGEAPPADPPKEERAQPATPELTFSDEEILNFMATFEQTYKNKDLPQEDAVATLANLRNAYRYLESLGDQRTKEQLKTQKNIVHLVAKKGLFARKRPLVNLECARVLGELGDQEGADSLVKWLEVVLEDKSPNPVAVQYGFQSLAWIGPEDKAAMEFVLEYATKGKHQDPGVAAHAIKAFSQWREIDGKTRKDVFDKVCGYMQGLYGKWKGGDAKQRGTYEQRYKAVETDGLDTLAELGDGQKLADPNAYRDWFNENKKRKWETYVGPRFRKAGAQPAPAATPEGEKDKGDEKPEG